MSELEIEQNKKEIQEVNDFIIIMLKIMFFGTCFVLIFIPLLKIFRWLT